MYSPGEMPKAAPLSDRSIVLVGLMGAGKSTVGKRLARRLGLPFVDSDEEIERAADRSISEIFDHFGEGSFRDGERRVIARLIEGPPKVIATGGGAFINDETRAMILERCVAIWLDADVETLSARVSRRDHRPLLRDKEPGPILQRLASARNPIYAEAHLHIHSAPAPHERTVQRIVEALAKWKATP
ncbi:shikimate kinase [Sphingosinicella humi]|uniref:Shikimate kinase n=1 Tax=Allosphingosinicella humi TaxID=2068657 RepID=A0A2U2J5G7_9SPHN|nr:shikimate kinase [Sphingosinicella humi]PWG03588.1 shikimate kinase [Sphingosinicella humi]